ncbi:YcgL domain-containing protein [Aeromonas enteropelogenes]|uniref:YcgL domain-containing protein MRK42_11135 n=1 Tax=Aeromonas sp. 19NY04SH05-1 TaxID=2920537 RepID=A0AAU6T3G6_9GAMM|nr:YcgL domain-containing protein [Aeromonas enteropelogenes]BEE21990.1 YcgL domain-containing protein [Aeromonas enteropelogenes]
MLCAVYKSRKKAETYLFVERREDFSRVPEALMTTFGRPELVLMTKLDPAKPLGLANVSKVMEALTTQGFYLQVPPPPENLLEQHKAQLKKSG